MKIRITGGYVGEVSVTIRDLKGADLSLAGLKMMLLRVGDSLPEKNSSAWKDPSEVDFSSEHVYEQTEPVSTKATLTMLVSQAGGYAIGRYRLWVLASLAPAAIPFMAEDEVIELL